MHIRNDGKPFNVWRDGNQKWKDAARVAMQRSIILPPVRVSRFRIMLASFVMWVFTMSARMRRVRK